MIGKTQQARHQHQPKGNGLPSTLSGDLDPGTSSRARTSTLPICSLSHFCPSNAPRLCRPVAIDRYPTPCPGHNCNVTPRQAMHEKLTGGGVDSDRRERHNLLAWLINPATTKLLSPFTQEPQTRSRPAWLADLHGMIPFTSGSRPLVSTSLLYLDPDTTTPHSH